MNLWPENQRRPGHGVPEVRRPRPSRRRPVFAAVAAGAVLALAAASCSSGGSGTSSSSSNQVAASAKQTIVFATQGLGGEGTATTAAIKAFEKLHPNITVKSARCRRPRTSPAAAPPAVRLGSGTPDLITSGVTGQPRSPGRAGSRAGPLRPNTASSSPPSSDRRVQRRCVRDPVVHQRRGPLLPHRSGQNPPGDTRPTGHDAQDAMKKDPSLKEGLAFEGLSTRAR